MSELVKVGNKTIGKNVPESNKVTRLQTERDYYMDNWKKNAINEKGLTSIQNTKDKGKILDASRGGNLQVPKNANHIDRDRSRNLFEQCGQASWWLKGCPCCWVLEAKATEGSDTQKWQNVTTGHLGGTLTLLLQPYSLCGIVPVPTASQCPQCPSAHNAWYIEGVQRLGF